MDDRFRAVTNLNPLTAGGTRSGRTFWLFVLAAAGLDVVRWTGTTLSPELLADRNAVDMLADREVETTAAYGRIFKTHYVVAAGFLSGLCTKAR